MGKHEIRFIDKGAARTLSPELSLRQGAMDYLYSVNGRNVNVIVIHGVSGLDMPDGTVRLHINRFLEAHADEGTLQDMMEVNLDSLKRR